MVALLELAPVFLLALAILLWPHASARLIEAIVEPPRQRHRSARKLGSRRPPRSLPDRGRLLNALRGARAPPLGPCRA